MCGSGMRAACLFGIAAAIVMAGCCTTWCGTASPQKEKT